MWAWFPRITCRPHRRITACMLRIPYHCPPNPDEMFGSWLPRVRLHNGEAVWKTIWGRRGIDQPSNSIPFDIPKLNDDLVVLLEYLEITYDNVLRTLTTLPYWLTFGGSDNTHTPSTVQGNTPRVSRIYRPTSVGLQRGDRFVPRLCPLCIAEDLADFGEPYWHRSHQLPNVFFCTRHECALKAACHKCGLPVARRERGLISLPPLSCRCGKDLRFIPKAKTVSAAHLRLARLSVHGLEVAHPRWSGADILAYLRHMVREKSGYSGLNRSIFIEGFSEVCWRLEPPDATITRDVSVELRSNTV